MFENKIKQTYRSIQVNAVLIGLPIIILTYKYSVFPVLKNYKPA